jgi:hypothetical protein
MQTDPTKQIREAIAAQDYATALRLWNSYVNQARRALNDGSFPAERMTEVRDLFEWGRNALLCARSQTLDQLNAIHVATAYTNNYITSESLP